MKLRNIVSGNVFNINAYNWNVIKKNKFVLTHIQNLEIIKITPSEHTVLNSYPKNMFIKMLDQFEKNSALSST